MLLLHGEGEEMANINIPYELNVCKNMLEEAYDKWLKDEISDKEFAGQVADTIYGLQDLRRFVEENEPKKFKTIKPREE